MRGSLHPKTMVVQSCLHPKTVVVQSCVHPETVGVQPCLYPESGGNQTNKKKKTTKILVDYPLINRTFYAI